MVKNRVLAVLLLVSAVALTALGVQTLRLGRQIAEDTARIDWLVIEPRGYVQRGVGMLVLAAGGFAAALGVYRNRPWGRLVLAVVLSAASVGALALRVTDTPPYARPDLGLLAAVSALAVWSWIDIFRLGRSPDA
jgi:hypothetical protein